MKSLPTDKFPTSAIKVVACERMTDVGEMNAYLMSSARFEINFKKRVTAAVHDRFVMRNGSLTVVPNAAGDDAFMFTCDRRFYRAAFGNYSLSRGEIYFSAFFLQQISRKWIFRRQTQSRSILVESIDRAES